MQIAAAVVIAFITAFGLAAGVASSSPYFDSANMNSILSALVADGGANVRSGVTYGDHARHRLDIYEPEKNDADVVVMFLYGGGWKTGRRSTYGFVGAALASRGISVVIPDYRLFPNVRFPTFVEDAAKAYAWTAKNVARGRPIYLMGHSAGAHIAALLALDTRYIAAAGSGLPKPAGLIGLAGPYAFDPTTWPTTKDIFSTARNADTARPVAFVGKNAPPALLFHGSSDKIVKMWNMEDMAKAYAKAGARIETEKVRRTGHIGIVLALARPFRWRHSILEDVVRFVSAGGSRPR